MDLSMFSLIGKTALVTGGNSGIGLGIARGLVKAGARVAIVGRSEMKCADALAGLRAIGGENAAIAFTGDLADTDAIPALFDAAAAALGGVDVLVNSAGITYRSRADLMPLAEYERVLHVNLTAPYVLSQCFARARIAAGLPGSIIMIASLMSEASRPTTSAYTASKGGIRQLVRGLAVDWAPFGIRVNGIGPGFVHTPMNQVLIDNPEFDAWVKRRAPLGRWGTPEDFEGVAVFLASDAARFMTGQIVYVDGGWLATF
ncbi:MAG: SDR family NAD(P)-dependent oxidoreductase [Anaerolineae bacterium]